jgi:hypothetical protein
VIRLSGERDAGEMSNRGVTFTESRRAKTIDERPIEMRLRNKVVFSKVAHETIYVQSEDTNNL